MRILLIGGNGFIGSPLRRELIAHGHSIAVLHRTTEGKKIRTELHYKELVDQDEALRRTIAWEQNHPPVRVNPQQFDYAAEDRALYQA